MASAVSSMDDLVKDYLLFRGFSATLKSLEGEIKTDKDRGLRVEKILELLQSYVTTYEIGYLREFWTYLDSRYFARLELVYISSVRKLEVSLFRWYVINAVQNGRNEKVVDFFEKMAPDLSPSEWRDWFALPFTRNPEDVSAYSMYFTKQWQDTFLLSLHNFLSVIFQSMPLPSLLMFDTDLKRMKRLQNELDHYKKQLSVCDAVDFYADNGYSNDNKPRQVIQYNHLELVDDFYDKASSEIADEEAPTKGVMKLFGKITSPSSPTSRARQSTVSATTQAVGATKKLAATNETQGKFTLRSTLVGKSSSNSSGARQKKSPDPVKLVSYQRGDDPSIRRSSDQGNVVHDTVKDSSSPGREASLGADQLESGVRPYILLSQDEYGEHHSAITHCRFSDSGKHAASSDMDGVVKIWSVSPTPYTITTVMSKASLMCFEWTSKTDRLLLLGNKASQVKLYDVKEKRNLIDVAMDSTFPRITCLLSNPLGNHFACAASSKVAKLSDKSPRLGQVTIWNLKTMQKEGDLALNPAVNCMAYNHNGQLLIVGTSNGYIRLFDVQNHKCITSWPAHTGDVHTVQFSNDETSCYSLGADGQFVQWSIHRNGARLYDWAFHQGVAGPFAVSSYAGQKTVLAPRGRLFACDAEKQCVLTCKGNTGVIYRLEQQTAASPAKPVVVLNGHKNPVITVDWSNATDGRLCLTGSMDGKIMVSTLLK